MSEAIHVHKITLSTGKVVILKDIELRDEEMATKAAGRKVASENAMEIVQAMGTELTKILILEVDGHKLTATEKEKIDSFLRYAEFSQVRRVVQKLMGESQAEPTVEFVPSGKQ